MTEEFDFAEDGDSELIARFEVDSKNGTVGFYDVEEFEILIDHYLDYFDFDQAELLISQATAIYPAVALFKIKRADLLSSTGKTEEALVLLEELALLEPDSAEVWTLFADVYSQMDQPDQAIACYKKAALSDTYFEDSLMSISAEYEKSGAWENAVKILKTLLRRFPKNDSALHELLYCYENHNDLESAAKFFLEFTEENPFSTAAWFDLGITFCSLELYEKGIDAYDFAISIDEEYASASFNKGNALSRLERFEEAIETYNESMEVDGEDAQTLLYIAESYEHLEQYDTAMKYVNKSLEIDDFESEAYRIYASCLMKTEHFEASIPYLKRALEFEPDSAFVFYQLGLVYAYLSNEEEALKCLERSIELDNEILESQLLYISLTALNADSNVIVSYYEALIANFPEEQMIYHRFFVYLFNSGEKERALGVLEVICEKFSESILMDELLKADGLLDDQHCLDILTPIIGKGEKAIPPDTAGVEDEVDLS